MAIANPSFVLPEVFDPSLYPQKMTTNQTITEALQSLSGAIQTLKGVSPAKEVIISDTKSITLSSYSNIITSALEVDEIHTVFSASVIFNETSGYVIQEGGYVELTAKDGSTITLKHSVSVGGVKLVDGKDKLLGNIPIVLLKNGDFWEEQFSFTSTKHNAAELYRYSRVGNWDYGGDMKDPHFVVADGRIIDLANYPEVLEKIQANKLHARTSYSANYKGVWARHSGTEYYAPNLDSYFIRSSFSSIGKVEEDAIRNITGSFYSRRYGASLEIHSHSSGAISLGISKSRGYTIDTTQAQLELQSVTLDTSKQVPTASENRPKNIYQVPVIYMGKLASEV